MGWGSDGMCLLSGQLIFSTYVVSMADLSPSPHRSQYFKEAKTHSDSFLFYTRNWTGCIKKSKWTVMLTHMGNTVQVPLAEHVTFKLSVVDWYQRSENWYPGEHLKVMLSFMLYHVFSSNALTISSFCTSGFGHRTERKRKKRRQFSERGRCTVNGAYCL